MFTAREKEIQLHHLWQFHSIFPVLSLSWGKKLPLAAPAHSALISSAVTAKSQCQLCLGWGRLSAGNWTETTICLWTAVRWQGLSATTFNLASYRESLHCYEFLEPPCTRSSSVCSTMAGGLESEGPSQCAGHTWQPVLTHTERAWRASAELTWNARLRARGAGQVPGKINSTEPPGGECWLLLCITALCQVICDFMLASVPKGELFLCSPQLARKSRLKTRICLGDSRQDQTQPA